MAISILTDSERKVYNEVMASAGRSTITKIKTALQECGLTDTPAQVIALRQEIEKQRRKGRGLWQAVWHGIGIVKSEGDKLFKE
jgi:hypothetical protein